jgi:PPK2 family polyphosphate:nucleotide phosphotransferase
VFEAVQSPWLVPFDGSFRQADVPTVPPADAPRRKVLKADLRDTVERFAELQEKLYAEDSRSLLLVFQAMDAAGKDSTIRAATSGVNPAGFQVCSFKQPSKAELDHDFLWRTTKQNPERGRIGIFNRSYYEEVLVVRVHPEYLAGRPRPPWSVIDGAMWSQRFESIRDHERHLAREGTSILKFWLKVSKEEQARRFLSRIDVPGKNWKFSGGDMHERTFWTEYHHAYEEAIAATSRPWAPWYAIPADDKPFMRREVASIIVAALAEMDPQWPTLPEDEQAELAVHAEALRSGRA